MNISGAIALVLCYAALASQPAASISADNITPTANPTKAHTSGPITLPGGDLDEQRYIGIDQIKPQMTGYGLTVFSGMTPERFDIIVVSVLKNFSAKRDAILIKCIDERFDIARGVQGVSGSPVYFDGRLAGAMAFGWAYSEEPLYGVTPIKQMLDVRSAAAPRLTNTGRGGDMFDRSGYQNMMRDVLLTPQQIRHLVTQAGLGQTNFSDSHATAGLTPLPVAMAFSGLSAAAVRRAPQMLGGLGFLTGPTAAAQNTSAARNHQLQPGSTLTIPLITGDINGAVLGTVTEVVGNAVYGFGHGWNANGAAAWPMGTGYVHTFVSRQNISFKLGQAVEVIGAIRADQAAGIYGNIGNTVDMVPMTIEVTAPDDNHSEHFQVQLAQDERADPILAAASLMGAILQKGELPRDHTISYDIEMSFDVADTIRFENVSSGHDIGEILTEVLSPLALLLNNPWQPVKLTAVNARATVNSIDSVAIIKSAQLSQLNFKPGQTVTAQVELEPRRARPTQASISLQLPADLPDGKYKLALGSARTYQQQLRTARRDRYLAFDAQDVQRILQERLTIRRDRLYMSLIELRQGLAIEGAPLPALPASKAMLLIDKSRHRIMTGFRPLIAANVATDYIIDGGATFNIVVER